MVELLSPAGSMQKLDIALNYGADAVYFAGKNFGLRAFAGNFSDEEIVSAINKCHDLGKNAYVTLNIIAHDCDFEGLHQYLDLLQNAKVDAVIVADIGILYYISKNFPKIKIHVSTQANVLNSQSAKFFADMGVERIVLARELSLNEIKEIRKNLPQTVQIECFVHGAMCISYSGRCLLSNYLANRDSNRGACVQACRWEYTITEKSRQGDQYEIQEDNRGTYILNSKDMCMINHIKELIDAGISSFKIEGRMKSEYYVAGVTNAYRRAIDMCLKSPDTFITPNYLFEELEKTSHRNFTTGFYFGEKDKEYLITSMPKQSSEFMAIVLQDTQDGQTLIEMRNRFKVGDELEILSPTDNFNKTIKVEELFDKMGESVQDAKKVQEQLYLKSHIKLNKGDILRKNIIS